MQQIQSRSALSQEASFRTTSFRMLGAASDPDLIQQYALQVTDLVLQSRRSEDPAPFDLPIVRMRQLERKFHEAGLLAERLRSKRGLLGTLEVRPHDSISLLGAYAEAKWTGSMPLDVLGYALSLRDLPGRERSVRFFGEVLEPLVAKRSVCLDNNRVAFPGPSHWFEYSHYSEHNDVDGKTVALLMVQTAPAVSECGLASRVLQETLQAARAEGAEFAFGFARLPGLRERFPNFAEAHQNLQAYCGEQRAQDGLHPDRYIRFHQRAGGLVIAGVPFVAVDLKSHHCGALVVYDLREK